MLPETQPSATTPAPLPEGAAAAPVVRAELTPEQRAYREARDTFINQWGAMGSSWGITRTMAQVHALFLVSPVALTTDAVMEELDISRGNASTSLRELVSWGLLRPVLRKGERKEYFEAEKDVWRIFCIIARERKRREIDPALEVLRDCQKRVAGVDTAEADAFRRQLGALASFVETGSGLMDQVAASEPARLFPRLLGLLLDKGGQK